VGREDEAIERWACDAERAQLLADLRIVAVATDAIGADRLVDLAEMRLELGLPTRAGLIGDVVVDAKSGVSGARASRVAVG
jgi:hypothetical protein